MDIKGEVKDVQSTSVKSRTTDDKSTLSFLSIAGAGVIIAGIIVGIFTSWSLLITNVALGVLILGLGEVVRILQKNSQ